MFEKIVGHSKVKSYLTQALKKNRLSQTLLFYGPDGVGKKTMALELAKDLLTSDKSTDLHHIQPEGKTDLFPIEKIRKMIVQANAPAFEGKGKVFIIEDVDRMLPSAANALLKTLEEPQADTTFILLTSKLQNLLPTIVSRTAKLYFEPLKEQEVANFLHDQGHPIQFAKLSQGSIGKAQSLATDPLFSNCLKTLFSLLQSKPSYPILNQEIEKMDKALLKVKEDEPHRYFQMIDDLFTSIAMWMRDRELEKVGGSPTLAYFPENGGDTSSSKDFEELIERGKEAVSRNMKFSHSLTYLLLKVI